MTGEPSMSEAWRSLAGAWRSLLRSISSDRRALLLSLAAAETVFLAFTELWHPTTDVVTPIVACCTIWNTLKLATPYHSRSGDGR